MISDGNNVPGGVSKPPWEGPGGLLHYSPPRGKSSAVVPPMEVPWWGRGGPSVPSQLCPAVSDGHAYAYPALLLGCGWSRPMPGQRLGHSSLLDTGPCSDMGHHHRKRSACCSAQGTRGGRDGL